MDAYTSDSTVIGAAQNFCVHESQAGREPIFETLVAGAFTTWRQRRLFESAMLEWMTRERQHQSEAHQMAVRSVEQFRFENYGQA